jgi:dipeptidase D
VLDKTVKHGPLELLFTLEEEIGLVGALNLKNENNFLTGTILLNVDSGTNGQLTIGCAGGQRFEGVTYFHHLTQG